MKLIPLTQGKFAKVDDEVFDELSKYKWYFSRAGYAIRSSKVSEIKNQRKTIHMHREILKPHENMYVDHIDGDKINNQTSNLRICTNAENKRNAKINSRNTSGFKGVSWITRDKKWVAQIIKDYKNINLGYFDDPIEAAKTYDKAAKFYFGIFAKTNF